MGGAMSRFGQSVGLKHAWMQWHYMLLWGILVSGVIFALSGQAIAASAHTMKQYTAMPVGVQATATPLVMLAMTKGHTLWREAYNNYTDLDGDGLPESTYKHSINYYGYFEIDRCYDYDDSANVFLPKAISSNKYCDTVDGAFSGNFLNWATMTRMDIVRKLLYGGKRSTDTATATILERVQQPNDAHSFSKWYNGNDIAKLTPWNTPTAGSGINDGITICNTTPLPGVGLTFQVNTNPSVIRILKGNWSLWGASERANCLYKNEYKSNGHLVPTPSYIFGQNGNDSTYTGMNAHTDSPANNTISDVLAVGADKDLVMRIKACSEARIDDAYGIKCKAYGSSIKPVGLLQDYGEDGTIQFGLITGSYLKNGSGGVLRKNVRDMVDEVNLTNGVFLTPANGQGIITTINRLNIIGYNYGMYLTYEAHQMTYNGIWGDNCDWGSSDLVENKCRSWGDPFSEMYLESLRYFGGLTATASFAADDSTVSWTGWDSPWNTTRAPRTATWSSPLTSSNSCAALNIVGLSTGVHTDDADALGGFADLKAASLPPSGIALTADAWTKKVGDLEGITGGQYLVGESGASTNQYCTGKTISNLGQAKGICPFAPRQEGSYALSGMAYYARTQDINAAVAGEQRVSTYGIDFGGDLPVIEVRTPDETKTVRITPSYRNLETGSTGSLVNFYVAQPHAVSGGTATGKYVVVWEDGEFGGDYDWDILGTIQYAITNDQITVTTDVVKEAAEGRHLFGFSLTGTNRDGFHAYSGVQSAIHLNAQYNDEYGDVKDCDSIGGCWLEKGPESHIFALGVSSAKPLKSPFYYAAKYGGFVDEDKDGLINSVADWDRVNNLTGAASPDGEPDNYFSIRNALGLVSSLETVLETIKREAKGAAEVAIGMSELNGVGAVYHAYYESRKESKAGAGGSWVGHLNALWVDSHGYLREDGDADGVLDSYNVDKVISVDSVGEKVEVKRYASTKDDEYIPGSYSKIEISEIKPLWSAVNNLAAYSVDQLEKNRNYTSDLASTGRYIFSALPDAGKDFATSSHVVDFDEEIAEDKGYAYLNVDTETEGKALVSYVRGQEISGMRNRTVDGKVYRLGDIVNSSMMVVGPPSEAYDQLYSDSSYFDFKYYHRKRRHVVYVGANDGMLHAFNSGFLVPGKDVTEYKKMMEGASGLAHPLGAELWAYAPANALPSLKWLADPDYSHISYVDGAIRVFDAKVFDADDDHVQGWGTVLVAGMRFGGGPMTVDLDPGDDVENHTFRSSYMVFDVTNPEKPPKLLAEFSHADLGYTLSEPTVVRATSGNQWYLVFGSGPSGAEADAATTLSQAGSHQKARVFVWDLSDRDDTLSSIDVDDVGHYVTHPLSVDWDLDGSTDAIYVGTAKRDNQTSRSGGLFKIATNEKALGAWDEPVLFVKTGRAITARPTATLDEQNRRWIFTSTGRLTVTEDLLTSDQEMIVGVIDTESSSDYPLDVDDLVDVSSAVVKASGTEPNLVYTVTGVDDVEGNIAALQAEVIDKHGWVRQLTTGSPSARAPLPSPLVNQILFTPTYLPVETTCNDTGTTRIYGVCYNTGTACGIANVFADSRSSDGVTDIDLTIGARISPISVLVPENQSSAVCEHTAMSTPVSPIKLFANTSDNAIIQQEACVAGSLRSGDMAWREVRE
jgi:type IV pilus assembly protein PilY1